MATHNSLKQLIIEQHPVDYTGFPFITLIQYRKEVLLAVVDNSTSQFINVYILDLCTSEGIEETLILPIIQDWYDNKKDEYPLSLHFSRLGLTSTTGKIYKTLSVEFITRFIGPIFYFPMNQIRTIKKRKRKQLPTNIEIKSTVQQTLE